MRRPVATPPDAALRASRRHPSSSPSTRTETQRDRDRILYSSAFLRLGQVTQVASADPGRIFHSRLTHSLKVAQVGRRLSERIATREHSGAAAVAVAALDDDAVEACALAHDLGHPPFGHLAEEELNERAKDFGGFEGNAQSFRLLTRLTLRDVKHPGLNLTRQTLNGVLKYPWHRHLDDAKHSRKWGAYDADREDFAWTREHSEDDAASLEARVMDWADDVTYAVHDMDDFFRAGLIPLDDLCRGGDCLDAFRAYIERKAPESRDAVDRIFPALAITTRYEGRIEERAQLRTIGSFLITRYIDAFRVVDADGRAEIEIDDDRLHEVTVLKRLIWFFLIERPSLATVQRGQRRLIGDLVDMYLVAAEANDRRLFPPVFQQRLDLAETEDASRRVAIDLVAGLTEDSALEIYRRAMGIVPGSLLSAPSI